MLRLKSKILSIIATTIIFASFTNVIFASNNPAEINLSAPVINPDSLYYPLKRVWEKVRDQLNFSDDAKITFAKDLLRERLAELKFVVENKILSEVEHSSQRFAFQAGILVEEIAKQNKSSEKEKLMKEFEQYNTFLGQLRDKYQANSSFWMLIQHDINSLGILSEKLK